MDDKLGKETNELYKTFLEPVENYLRYLRKVGFVNIKLYQPPDYKNNMGFTVNIIYAEKPQKKT